MPIAPLTAPTPIFAAALRPLPELPLRDAVVLGAWALAFEVPWLPLLPLAVPALRLAVLRLAPLRLAAALRFDVLRLLALLRALL
jgi:hypothetical protein